MSLAFAHDETILRATPARRTTAHASKRKSAADLAVILAFVALSIVSILAVAQPSSPDTERTIAAFAEL